MEEKAARDGRTFARIGRFEPTSQVCSACGVKDGPKPLSVREWACAACGTVHDRDVNAARNILAAGRGGQSQTLVEPVSDHASWQLALNRNPPERGVSRAGGIPVVHGGEDVKEFSGRAASPEAGPPRPRARRDAGAPGWAASPAPAPQAGVHVGHSHPRVGAQVEPDRPQRVDQYAAADPKSAPGSAARPGPGPARPRPPTLCSRSPGPGPA